MKMNKNYVVIGAGRFGRAFALTLQEAGGDVTVLDSDIKEIDLIKDSVAHAICVDVTDEDAMAALELDRANTVVVAIGEDQQASIFCTAILKQLGVRNIIARAVTRLHGQILKQVGATRVISVEEQMGEQLAKNLMAPYIFERLELPDGLMMAEIEAPKEFVGKSLIHLEIRKKYGLYVLALKKLTPAIDSHGENTFTEKVLRFPPPSVKIEAGHIMTVVGTADAIETLTSSR
jgi:trk system potassium uptake protein